MRLQQFNLTVFHKENAWNMYLKIWAHALADHGQDVKPLYISVS